MSMKKISSYFIRFNYSLADSSPARGKKRKHEDGVDGADEADGADGADGVEGAEAEN